ncbi:MAG: Dabb family protein [Cyclobacteriaceae bacterium]
MGKAKKINGRFIHMVFFWLKDSTNPDEFIKITEAFVEQIDEVNSFHVGKPAGTPREVVDNTYQVSLVVTFDSKEEQDVYQDHPIHVKYVEDNKEKWETVQIYDSWGEVYA